jgi:hypothetical protein
VASLVADAKRRRNRPTKRKLKEMLHSALDYLGRTRDARQFKVHYEACR